VLLFCEACEVCIVDLLGELKLKPARLHLGERGDDCGGLNCARRVGVLIGFEAAGFSIPNIER
jgi:hypothetical protein